MKFKDFKYERIDATKFEEDIKLLINLVNNSTSFKQADEAFIEFNKLRNKLETAQSLVYIRYNVNTTDPLYVQEQDYMDEYEPIMNEPIQNFLVAINANKFLPQFKRKYGSLLFKKIELSIKTFNNKIINDLQLENKLTTKYSNLLASAKIEFDGKIQNLSKLSAYRYSLDRELRKGAALASANFMLEHLEEFDDIYDQLVKVRTKIAKALKYENFIQLGYDRLGRIGYGPKKVAGYRKQIFQDLLPLTKQLRTRQMQRLNISDPQYYDWAIAFNNGMPKPEGDCEFMINQAEKMYDKLSKETSDFFKLLNEQELYDLVAKDNKSGGGFCTFMPDFQAPFIFSNFNGSKDDVDVLTHEFGHAFQAYLSKDILISEYRNPSYESCEIHSMAMEFIAWPYMELFFGKQADKYRFNHLESALNFMPYGAAVDEFQHHVYQYPDLTKEARRQAWLDIHKKYEPHLKMDNMPFINIGGRFMYQSHIYEDPFYYIDYTLAQIVALSFLNLANVNQKYAWETYLKLCKLGGSKSFTNLLKAIDFSSPFDNGTIKNIIKPLKEYLNSIDDKKL